MVLGSTIEVITRAGGSFVSRWLHVIVGITWIGLLYYFNFVQTPAYAELDGDSRNKAFDKITWRALWWFRWSAAATVATGILILAFGAENGGRSDFTSADFWKANEGVAIATGILLALTMFLNVWLVIWPKQQVVIGNARNVLAGGEADPAAPAAARRGALASRMNTIFSIPMLLFMVAAPHFFAVGAHFNADRSGRRTVYWIITIIVWGVLELNALGLIGGTAQNWTKKIFETHLNAIITGFVLAVGWYALWEIVFRV
jgi:uncharacterized membrane protein